jgi:plastocyanin
VTRDRLWADRTPVAALVAAGVLILMGPAGSPRAIGPDDPHRRLVEIRGMAFHPEVLEVRRGDTVVWVNRDIVPHSATAKGKPGWTTGPLRHGMSGQMVADQPGESSYFCELHPTMHGKLIIR